ncbi:thrombopoietin [Fundulus heteroclitus]|uniref:thrombopoietin n=1 Tax=Fundulus heteroclitus TaxID=8078 RepID=UPI00165A7CBE|nr:thrombopoietin [Fundulus heteroclitus]
MAYSRLLLLLLLLIGATITHLPQAHAHPDEFWCNAEDRKNLMEDFDDKDNCSEISPVPPVPYIGVNPEEWEKKSLQEKQAEVLKNFQGLHDSVQQLMNQTRGHCLGWLNAFEKSISQYMIIVGDVLKQNDSSTPTQAPKYEETTKLKDVWNIYERLIVGKLELLAYEMSEDRCKHKRKRSLRQLWTQLTRKLALQTLNRR